MTYEEAVATLYQAPFGDFVAGAQASECRAQDSGRQRQRGARSQAAATAGFGVGREPFVVAGARSLRLVHSRRGAREGRRS